MNRTECTKKDTNMIVLTVVLLLLIVSAGLGGYFWQIGCLDKSSEDLSSDNVNLRDQSEKEREDNESSMFEYQDDSSNNIISSLSEGEIKDNWKEYEGSGFYKFSISAS